VGWRRGDGDGGRKRHSKQKKFILLHVGDDAPAVQIQPAARRQRQRAQAPWPPAYPAGTAARRAQGGPSCALTQDLNLPPPQSCAAPAQASPAPAALRPPPPRPRPRRRRSRAACRARAPERLAERCAPPVAAAASQRVFAFAGMCQEKIITRAILFGSSAQAGSPAARPPRRHKSKASEQA